MFSWAMGSSDGIASWTVVLSNPYLRVDLMLVTDHVPMARARLQAFSKRFAPKSFSSDKMPRAGATPVCGYLQASRICFTTVAVAGHLFRPASNALWGPGGLRFMRGGHVRSKCGLFTLAKIQPVASDTLVFVKDLDCVCGDASEDIFTDQRVGDAVEVLKVLDVVVFIHLLLAPIFIFVACLWQCFQCRFVDLLEPLAPSSGKFFEWSIVQIGHEQFDCCIQLGETKEVAIAYSSEDPGLAELDTFSTLALSFG